MATLERLRSCYEEIEAIDKIIVEELDNASAKTQREQIESDHRVATYLDAERELANDCVEIYKDTDKTKQVRWMKVDGESILTFGA